MKYVIDRTSVFRRDYKRAVRRNLPMEKLQTVIALLASGEELPPKYRDHTLTGNWKNHRECHVAPDWLLIYQIQEDVLVLELTRTGSHADLF